jgi:hypothetical protein
MKSIKPILTDAGPGQIPRSFCNSSCLWKFSLIYIELQFKLNTL